MVGVLFSLLANGGQGDNREPEAHAFFTSVLGQWSSRTGGVTVCSGDSGAARKTRAAARNSGDRFMPLVH